MTAPAEAVVRALAERDGCRHPAYVAQCVHFEGQGLYLTNFDMGYGVHGPARGRILELCRGCKAYATEAEARDEFALRERKLLGREEA